MKHIKTFESFGSLNIASKDELNESWLFKTPEELLAKGKKSLNKDTKMTRIYNTIVSEVKSGKYPKGAEDKYLMFYAKTGDTFATFYSWLEAPDGTEGYWGKRGLTRGAGGSGKNMGA
jgi:hypothetical protein